MKRTLLTIITIFTGCLFAFSQIVSTDFETWSGGFPAGWGGSKTNIGGANIIEYTTSAHGGAKSCQLVNATTSHKRFTTTNVTVAPQTQYEIKFWVRGSGQVRTGLFDGRATGSGYAAYNAYVTATATWTEYTQTVTAETSADTAQFILSVLSTAAADHIQIDDVTITTGGVVTPTEVTIYDIQYTTATPANSPYLNQPVITKGIVTGKYTSGFYIQDGNGAWNGVLVVSNQAVAQGDSVQVTGNVQESFNNTQIVPTAVTVLNSGNVLPTPAIVTAELVNSENYEGCLVTIQSAKCTDTNSGYGMWKLEDPSDTCKVFDQFYAYTPTLNQFYNVTGPIYYAYSEARICPRNAADVTIASNVNATETEVAGVYPNPASSQLYFTNISLGSMYEITDISGRIVLSSQFLGQPVGIESLAKGVYYLRISGKEGMFTHTFVKE